MRPVLALVLIVACSRDDAPPTPEVVKPPPNLAPGSTAKPPPPPAALTRVTIKALGMYCEESCPLKVRYALADVPAVYELGFDVSTESIFVSYDSSLGEPKKVTKPMLVAIKGAGFDPWLAKESWPADAKADVIPR